MWCCTFLTLTWGIWTRTMFPGEIFIYLMPVSLWNGKCITHDKASWFKSLILTHTFLCKSLEAPLIWERVAVTWNVDKHPWKYWGYQYMNDRVSLYFSIPVWFCCIGSMLGSPNPVRACVMFYIQVYYSIYLVTSCLHTDNVLNHIFHISIHCSNRFVTINFKASFCVIWYTSPLS